MSEKKIKVLYIAGQGRSGSTILGNVLGQIDGFFHTGELSIWPMALLHKVQCGCALDLRECPIWSKVFKQALGDMSDAQMQEVVNERMYAFRTRNLPWLYMPGARGHIHSHLKNYLSTLDKLYRSVQDVTGCRVIVDSSKGPGDLRVLSELPGIEVYVLHLIRDPRAFAHSWSRKEKILPGFGPLGVHKPGTISIFWDIWNFAVPYSARAVSPKYFRLLYEDFIKEPQKTIRAILDFADEKVEKLPFSGKRQVELEKSHGLMGNPSRSNIGKVDLKIDSEWRNKMPLSGQWRVTAITWPLMLRYGYPLWNGRSH